MGRNDIMISSMTGYGRGESKDDNKIFTVEMKSVNHRYNDIIIRMPKKLSIFEERIRNIVKNKIRRGRIEIHISVEYLNETNLDIKPNLTIIKQYYNTLNQIKDEINIDDDINLSLLTSFPDALKIEYIEEDEETTWKVMESAVVDALNGLVEMRKVEGLKLAEDIRTRNVYIYEIVKKIEDSAPIILKEYKEKLKERIKELIDDSFEIDDNRIALELAIYADKSNITEEIVRLYSHIDQLNNIIKESGAVGRKLDFLIQEMNREVNTIGSKSLNVNISNYVIEIKSELEKIREQIQNIE